MAEIALLAASAVLRQATVELGKLIVQEGSRLFRLTEDLEWIENEMRYIQAYLDDVEDKQWQSRGVTNLVRNIWDFSYDVQDIIATYFPKLATRGSSYKRNGTVAWLKNAVCCPKYYKTVRDFAVEIEGIKRRIEDIDRVRKTYEIKESSGLDDKGDTWDPRQSFSHVDEDPVGLEEDIKQLVDKVLQNDNSSHLVLPIIGMAGLGKTTLAKKVYDAVAKTFDCSAWIYVSQRPNVPKLLCDIAGQVGLEEEKMKKNLERNLFEFLGRKRYAIFIDDIWKPEIWDALQTGIPNNSKSIIVLTSRNRVVGVRAGGENGLHKLYPLGPEKSKKLFFKVAFPQENMDETICNNLLPELRNTREQILERCGGVPLAIVLTASMLRLRKKTENAWKGILASMGQEEDQYSKIFLLSYKDLPSKLKSCFLYFGLFPEDYEIHVFDLINLWAAEGFIQGNGVQQVEEVGEDHLDELIARNLIQVDRRSLNGRIKTCRIHDILHDLSVRVAKEINFFNTGNDIVVGDFGIKVRRVTTHDLFGYISLNYKTPRLRSMLSFETGRDDLAEKFFEDLRLVRVLRLNHPFGKIGHLSMLTYVKLKLKDCSKLTSSIINLKSLQTLDLRGSYDISIPICIWKMKQLRHLLLGLGSVIETDLRGRMLNKMGGKYFHHPIEAFSNTNLETLYELYFPESSPRHWFPKLTSLRKLGVRICNGDLSNVKALLDSVTAASSKLEILRLQNLMLYDYKYILKDLKLFSYENLFRMHLEGHMVGLTDKVLPPNLTKLTLRRTNLKTDPMETLKKLPKLKILKLLRHAYIEKKMKVSAERGTETGGPPHNFPQLQVLIIEGLDYLEELIVEEEMMPQLNKLIITDVRRDFVHRIPDKMEDIKPIIKRNA